MRLPLWLVFVIILSLSAYFQHKIIENEKSQGKTLRRLWVPVMFALAISLGVFSHALTAIENRDVHLIGGYWYGALTLLKSIVFGLGLVIQNYFSLISFGIIACTFVYGSMHGGDFTSTKDLLIAGLEWVLSPLPPIVGDVYSIVVIVIAFIDSAFRLHLSGELDSFDGIN